MSRHYESSYSDMGTLGESHRQQHFGPPGEHYEPGVMSGCALICGRCPKCDGRIVTETVYHEGQKSNHLMCQICLAKQAVVILACIMILKRRTR